jgi:phosphatidylglycerophosphatase A
MNVKQKAVMFLATGCFVGYIPFAPGTFGTGLGIPLSFFLSKIDLSFAILFTVVLILFAVWITGQAEKIIEQKDPGAIVIDEIVGFVITLIGLPFNLLTVIAGFLVFRGLDIFKPYPIRFFEKKLSGGTGVVMDDVVAGIFSNLILRILVNVIVP